MWGRGGRASVPVTTSRSCLFNGETSAQQNLRRTRWRRLLDVDDAEHLRGVAELFNLDGAHINSSPSKVRPLCEPA